MKLFDSSIAGLKRGVFEYKAEVLRGSDDLQSALLNCLGLKCITDQAKNEKEEAKWANVSDGLLCEMLINICKEGALDSTDVKIKGTVVAAANIVAANVLKCIMAGKLPVEPLCMLDAIWKLSQGRWFDSCELIGRRFSDGTGMARIEILLYTFTRGCDPSAWVELKERLTKIDFIVVQKISFMCKMNSLKFFLKFFCSLLIMLTGQVQLVYFTVPSYLV